MNAGDFYFALFDMGVSLIGKLYKIRLYRNYIFLNAENRKGFRRGSQSFWFEYIKLF
ncbi:hypothetical protein NIES4075_63380 [Tolypothrix sp. NIES-4075]|nr:hypothetical protein NIES4075_63380 [Tolypothrix sp. NIES-4075]